jgi:hypothetical protein
MNPGNLSNHFYLTLTLNQTIKCSFRIKNYAKTVVFATVQTLPILSKNTKKTPFKMVLPMQKQPTKQLIKIKLIKLHLVKLTL